MLLRHTFWQTGTLFPSSQGQAASRWAYLPLRLWQRRLCSGWCRCLQGPWCRPLEHTAFHTDHRRSLVDKGPSSPLATGHRTRYHKLYPARTQRGDVSSGLFLFHLFFFYMSICVFFQPQDRWSIDACTLSLIRETEDWRLIIATWHLHSSIDQYCNRCNNLTLRKLFKV